MRGKRVFEAGKVLAAPGSGRFTAPATREAAWNARQSAGERAAPVGGRDGARRYHRSRRDIFITGRKKELIVSSTGKKIHPARVENLFKMEPLVSQVLLIGDRLPFLTALFTINPVAAEALKGMEPWRGRPAAEIAEAPPVLAEIRKAVARVNKELAPFEQVRKYRVLTRDFSIEQGELTATMKIRRAQALENCKVHIDELYAGRE